MSYAEPYAIEIAKQRNGKVKYFRSASQIDGIPDDAARTIEEVSNTYVFRANDYYLGLIDWDDPDDPIRQLIIPRKDELRDWGTLDASDEASNTVVRGVQHKYGDTALVLVNNVCGSYCRYCFRKRLFMNENDETINNLTEAYAYIREHNEITDVLLTGGDPMIMPTRKLRGIVERFAAMPHIRTIRFGTKMPAFNPFRFTTDYDLHEMFRDLSNRERALFIMAHFDHPRELTPEARDGIAAMLDSSARMINQCPLIKGVNDNVDTLVELFETMTLVGAPQYYLFQGRPTAGNEPYELPIVEGWRLFDAARRRVSGLSRRARFSMSHASGKIEVLGVDQRAIYLRYHRAKDPANESRVLTCRRDDQAYWFDQLEPLN